MKRTLLLTLLAFLLHASATAQIGFKTTLVAPRGDYSEIYKNTIGFELNNAIFRNDGRFLGRMGFFYHKLAPRLASIPRYELAYQPNIGEHYVAPGSLAYEDGYMFGGYIDVNFRLYKVKGFSLYAGFGTSLGYNDYDYNYSVETVRGGANTTGGNFLLGVRPSVQVMYDVNSHLKLSLESTNAIFHAPQAEEDRNYTHRILGLNIYYIFKPEESDE